MSIEIWGTFSVRDHLVSRAFVADVLLYDRLVIPTLPENVPEEQWPAAWDLSKQRALLRDLGDLAIEIPWDEKREEAWQKRFDSERAEERRVARAEATSIVEQDAEIARDPRYLDQPYRITRQLLQDYVNDDADNRLLKKLRATRKARPGSSVEAVAAYPSFDSFEADAVVQHTPPRALMLAPSTVFGWRFFVPDSTVFSEDEDRRLLQKAMTLATKTAFIEMRGDFYQWWSDVISGELSAAEAKRDMEKRVGEYQNVIKAEPWKKVTRLAIKVADAFAGGLGLVNEIASVGAEAFLGSADIVADDRLRAANVPARLKVAAMFHDARRRLR